MHIYQRQTNMCDDHVDPDVILNEPQLMPKGVAYARDVLKCRWPAWEANALSLAVDDEENLPLCVEYAVDVIRARWNALEPILLQAFIDNGPYCMTVDDGRLSTAYQCVTEYHKQVVKGAWPDLRKQAICPSERLVVGRTYTEARRSGRWKAFEKKLLATDCMEPLAQQLEEIRRYSQGVIGDRWPEAEAFILRCLKTYPYDEIADKAVHYAAEVVQGRWQDLERRLSKHPEWMLSYADKVLHSRLPSYLHQKMVLETFRDPTNAASKEYIDRYGV